jgi:hypothetical protein
VLGPHPAKRVAALPRLSPNFTRTPSIARRRCPRHVPRPNLDSPPRFTGGRPDVPPQVRPARGPVAFDYEAADQTTADFGTAPGTRDRTHSRRRRRASRPRCLYRGSRPPAKPARRRPRLTVGLREPVANRARRRGSVHADRPDTEAVQLRENATTGPRWRFAATTVSDRTRGRRGTSALRAEPVPLRSRDALSWSSSPRIRSGNRFVHVTSSTRCTTGDRDAGQVARMAGTCADQHGPMSSPAAKRSMAPLIASSLGPRPGRSVAAEGFLDSAVRRKSHHPLEVGVQPRPV